MECILSPWTVSSGHSVAQGFSPLLHKSKQLDKRLLVACSSFLWLSVHMLSGSPVTAHLKR